MKKVNRKVIREELIKLGQEFIGERCTQHNIDKIGNKMADILYANGFSEQYRPVIPELNIKVECDPETKVLTLAYRPEVNKKWIEIKIKPLKE